MAITLSKGATTIELPESLSWADEFNWSPVQQTKTYTTTGALLLEHSVKQAGRPITLEGAEDRAWCTRAVVATLKAWAEIPGVELDLILRGAYKKVTFDHENTALEGFPILFYDDSSWDPQDFYYPTIRLITL